MAGYRYFVGVDIGAARASVAVALEAREVVEQYEVEQSAAGHQALCTRLLRLSQEAGDVLVVMEATGTYWMQLALALHEAGMRVSVINPSQAHHFARALLKRGKTDQIDAAVLAQLAAAFQPEAWQPPPAVYEELQQRLVQRDQLMEQLQQVRNQRHALQRRTAVVAAVLQRQENLLAFLQEQLAAVEEEIGQALRQDEAWAAAATRLQSIPGIGPLTAAWLLVATLNFSACHSPEAAAAYAGLVPVPKLSGTSVHGRSSIGHRGHKRLRTALYLAALSAVRYNPVVRPFYQRLLERGKLKQVALCAAARKLLHLAWAVVKKECLFDPNHRATVEQPLPS